MTRDLRVPVAAGNACCAIANAAFAPQEAGCRRPWGRVSQPDSPLEEAGFETLGPLSGLKPFRAGGTGNRGRGAPPKTVALFHGRD